MAKHKHWTEMRTHMSMWDLFFPYCFAFVLYGWIIAVFFIMGWHVPEVWQPFVTVVIFIPCVVCAQWIFYSIIGIRVRNQ